VWSGLDAQGNGLVDQLGGLQDAIAEVRTRAGISKRRALPLRVLPARPTLLDLLLQESGNPLGNASPLKRLADRRRAKRDGTLLADAVPLALNAALSRLPLSMLFLPQEHAAAVLPGKIEIR
jgi:protease-4